MRDLNNFEIFLAIALAFFAAYVSWRFVEHPFRRQNGVFRRKGMFVAAGAVMGIAIAAGLVTTMTAGLPARLPTSLAQADWMKHPNGMLWNADRSDCLAKGRRVGVKGFQSACALGDANAGGRKFLLWGDSHGESIRDAIDIAARHNKMAGYFSGAAGCPPVLWIAQFDDSVRKACKESSNSIMQAIAKAADIDRVLIVGHWVTYTDGTPYEGEGQMNSRSPNAAVFEKNLIDTIATLQARGLAVTLVAPVPEIGFHVPRALAMHAWHDRSLPSPPSFKSFQRRNQAAFNLLDKIVRERGVALIEPSKMLCNELECAYQRSDQPLYVDSHHLSREGARMLAPLFEGVFNRRLEQPILSQP